MNLNSIRQNPWPYVIIIYFVIFVGCIVGFVSFALRQNMDLVRKDYYEHEIQFQRQIDSLGRTSKLPCKVRAEYDRASEAIILRLPETHQGTGNKGVAHLYRPSDAKLDKEIPFDMEASHDPSIDVRNLEGGNWKLLVAWSNKGENFAFEQSLYLAGRPGIR